MWRRSRLAAGVLIGLLSGGTLAGESVLEVTRTACPSLEEESFSKCDGKPGSNQTVPAASVSQCTLLELRGSRACLPNTRNSHHETALGDGVTRRAPQRQRAVGIRLRPPAGVRAARGGCWHRRHAPARTNGQRHRRLQQRQAQPGAGAGACGQRTGDQRTASSAWAAGVIERGRGRARASSTVSVTGSKSQSYSTGV